jgi:pSer/pThr/pTyr-binding forkhead associated (FHA) protein
MAALKILSGPKNGQTISLVEGSQTLGAEGAADIVLGTVTVDRCPAKIIFAGGIYILQDLGSVLGTFLNGKRISKETLKDNDLIFVAQTQMRFIASEEAEAKRIEIGKKGTVEVSADAMRERLQEMGPGAGAPPVQPVMPQPVPPAAAPPPVQPVMPQPVPPAAAPPPVQPVMQPPVAPAAVPPPAQPVMPPPAPPPAGPPPVPPVMPPPVAPPASAEMPVPAPAGPGPGAPPAPAPPAVEPAFPCLVLRSDPERGKVFFLTGKSNFVVGRQEDVDLFFSDGLLSRKHCQISCTGGLFILRDLDSRNGTFVNGEKISRKVLEEGDIIVAGSTIFEFRRKA